MAASDNLEMIKVAPGGGKQTRQIGTPISCASILKKPHKWEGPIIAVSFSQNCINLITHKQIKITSARMYHNIYLNGNYVLIFVT